MKILRIFFIVFLITGTFFHGLVYAEDENNFEAKFTFTVTPARNTTATYFKLSAAGTFYVDWGDGNTETITRTNTNQASYTHRYTSRTSRTIKLGGVATAYSTGSEESDAAISFADNTYITGISGSLGRLFPTLSDGSQPLFKATFAENTNLAGTIPGELFDGITGQPRDEMFRSLFWNDKKLTGSIPGELFSGLYGTPTENLFYGVFYYCSGLTGSIPGELFAGIAGNQQERLFQNAFNYCSNLSSFIPPELFAGINVTPAVTGTNGAFTNVFANTTNMLTSCPSGYKKYTTGFESYFNNRVSCELDLTCPNGQGRYDGACYDLCSFGTKLMVDTGLSFDVFGELEPSSNPKLYIKLNNTTCYVFTKSGTGTFNFEYTDGKTYHLVGIN